MLFSRTFAAVLVALAAACQPLPQPFQPPPERKAANPLLQITDAYGVYVAGVAGADEATGEALAREMAAALVGRGIPAFTESGNAGSYTLSGTLAVPESREGRPTRLRWTLTDPDGAAVGTYDLDAGTVRGRLAKPGGSDLKGLAVRSAGPIAALVQEPAPVDRIGERSKLTLFVRPVEGAPEAAGGILREEAEAAFRRLDVKMAAGPGIARIVVSCTVTLSAAEAGRQRLALVWNVLRPDGSEIGSIRQENTLAPEALDRSWPSIARAIASGAAEGVRDILDRLPAQALDTPR